MHAVIQIAVLIAHTLHKVRLNALCNMDLDIAVEPISSVKKGMSVCFTRDKVKISEVEF